MPAKGGGVIASGKGVQLRLKAFYKWRNMDWKILVKRKVKCCACGGSLNDSDHINLVALDRAATWLMPVSGNALTGLETKQAVAVLCDSCANTGKAKIRYAVEWTEHIREVIYHEYEELDPLPTRIYEMHKTLAALCSQDPERN